MDARTGEVLFARNHDTRLHPASLTKMMTLYVAFEAVKHGEVSLDTRFTVSQRATGTPCVCLGLRPGQQIELRYLLRAAALRSANDASVVIAEGISGSVEAFAERMTRTARAMGMSNTTFRNPHGLTQAGHVSTARDMSILGRQLFFDYPQYFNMFSRRSDHAGVATVPNTNRRFLDAYQGANGIKTGFTRAAGFNLTASAQRGDRHIIATMFGGSSVAARNAHVAELLDIGFSRAPARVATRAPRTPAYQGRGAVAVAAAPAQQAPAAAPAAAPTAARAQPSASGGAAQTIRLQLAVRSSPRPVPRPDPAAKEELLVAVLQSVEAVVSDVQASAVTAAAPPAPASDTALSAAPPRPDDSADAQIALALAAGFAPASSDDLPAVASTDATLAPQSTGAPDTPEATQVATLASSPIPPARPAQVLAQAAPAPLGSEGLSPDTLPADTPFQIATPAPDTAFEPQIDAAASPVPAASVVAAAPVGADAGPAALPFAGHVAAQDDGLGSMTAGMMPIPAQPVIFAPPPRASGATAEPGTGPVLAEATPAVPQGMILSATDSNISATGARQAMAAVVEAHVAPEQTMISRVSTSDSGRVWGVSLGQFNSRASAERSLITVKMAEASALGNGVSRILQASGRFEATFAGLTRAEAERACLRLNARAMECQVAMP
ncbi:MAG: serine hydrolase [Roseinatronobacter sp.]